MLIMDNQEAEISDITFDNSANNTSIEDDDSHFCLRCRATIMGLEQYIQHRKEKCQSKCVKQSNTNVVNNLPHHSSYSIIPSRNISHARSYHQLSLTSPRHEGSSSRSDPVLSSSSNHIEERLKSQNQNDSSLVGDLSVDVPMDDFMSHLGLCMVSTTTWGGDIHSEEPLRADDFFSLLELQSCSKHPTKAGEPKRSRRNPESDSHKPVDGSGNEFADLSQVNDTDVPRNDEIIDTSSPIPTNEGINNDKWSPSYDNRISNSAQDLPSQNEPEPSVSNSSTELPSHSGPTPFPSRGKWMPGSKPRDIHKSGSSVEYDCKPCNRRLTGRAVYEKHLQSELHFKRVAQGLPLEPNPEHYALRQKRKALLSPESMQIAALEEEEPDLWWLKRRKGDKNTQRCPTCQVWVSRSVFGKHLVSQFHVSRSFRHPQRDQCILENIHVVVREAPFQCRLCRFYCHCHQDLLTHWSSADHRDRDAATHRHGIFFCSLCLVSCSSSDQMADHLHSEEHVHCVTIVNKSVTVMVNKLDMVQCHLCGKGFRYHIQLNKHIPAEHAVPLEFTSNCGQVLVCDHCPFRTVSNSSYTQHLFTCRKVPEESRLYRCLICRMSFASKEDVTRHRSTQDHRDEARSQRSGTGRSRSCPHCYRPFDTLPALKEHFQQAHPDLLPRCTSCGATFALKQQLSAHRRKDCTEVPLTESVALACSLCSYRCQIKADLLYHQAIEHRTTPDSSTSASSTEKYPCPECDQIYTKASLKAHLMSHTQELAFRCTHCGRRFRREEERLAHIRQLHDIKAKSTRKAKKTDGTVSIDAVL